MNRESKAASPEVRPNMGSESEEDDHYAMALRPIKFIISILCSVSAEYEVRAFQDL
jgi:hypothetical protein